MLPNVDPSGIEHQSEVDVYIGLRDQLGDDFVVFHSYPWLRPNRGLTDALNEGEADFVILHREHGILVLEVKGGSTIHHAGGTRWYRAKRGGDEYFKDPFEQAKRNMHALLNIAEERMGKDRRGVKRFKRQEIVHGYAVVFPHMDYQGEPPPHADKAIVISHRNMAFLEDAIMTAYRSWTESRREIDPTKFQELLRLGLMPKFRLYRPVGPDIRADSDRLLELTTIQAQVLKGLYERERVLVKGVAGSGKTFLALERALSFARDGKRTLFICYNKELAAWLSSQVDRDPSTASLSGQLDIKHFHGLAAELAKAADIDFSPAGGGPRDTAFWNEEVPDIMDQAINLGSNTDDVRYDAIVVDEAQDFTEEWWYVLTQSLLKNDDGPLYAFMDPNQSLFGEVQMPPVEFGEPFPLTMNCRNTRRIAAASACVLELEANIFPLAPPGSALRVLRAGSLGQQRGLVLEELRSLLQREDVAPEQIALIGPAAKDKGSLAGVADIDGVPMVTSAEVWRDGGGVLVTTSRSFKGLEAEVVILYDLGGFGRLFRREDLYVACTRAKVLLIAVVHGADCREVITAAQSAADTQT